MQNSNVTIRQYKLGLESIWLEMVKKAIVVKKINVIILKAILQERLSTVKLVAYIISLVSD